MIKNPWSAVHDYFYHNFVEATLKTMIVLWALFVIFLVIFVVDNKWLLAAILAYEVLP